MMLLKQGVPGVQVEEAESSRNRALGFIWGGRAWFHHKAGSSLIFFLFISSIFSPFVMMGP